MSQGSTSARYGNPAHLTVDGAGFGRTRVHVFRRSRRFSWPLQLLSGVHQNGGSGATRTRGPAREYRGHTEENVRTWSVLALSAITALHHQRVETADSSTSSRLVLNLREDRREVHALIDYSYMRD